MGMTLRWLGHASFRICDGETAIYVDPWKLKNSPHDATLVLVSHSHYDHYSANDIAGVSNRDTKLIASADVIATEQTGEVLAPGQTTEFGGVRVIGVPAYNPAKQFHPKANNWLGFIVEVGSKRIYYAGDTDVTKEMKALTNIDVALLPVGGTYTMNATEAAQAVEKIKPTQAVPYHWGDIVGDRSNAEQFANTAPCEVKVLSPGESVNL